MSNQKQVRVTFSRRSVDADSPRGILLAEEGGKVKTLSSAIHKLGEVSQLHKIHAGDIGRMISLLADQRNKPEAEFHDFAVSALESLKVKELKKVGHVVSMCFDVFVLVAGHEPSLADFNIAGTVASNNVDTAIDEIDISFLSRSPAGSGQPQTDEKTNVPNPAAEFTGKKSAKKS